MIGVALAMIVPPEYILYNYCVRPLSSAGTFPGCMFVFRPELLWPFFSFFKRLDIASLAPVLRAPKVVLAVRVGRRENGM